jgi:hypothetical protein
MPQSKTVAPVDDLTGRRGAETIVFALDGSTYEINLNKRNAALFRRAIGPYIKAGRPAGTTVEIDASALKPKRAAGRATATRGKRAATKTTAKTAPKTAAKTAAPKGAAKTAAKSAAKTVRASDAAPAKTRRGRGSARSAASSQPSSADVRAWAAGQGIELAARGRISHAVRDQYVAAHQG